MAGSRTGTPTIIKAARTICRMVGRYGAGNLLESTTPEFEAAVLALVAACTAFEALDNYPAEVEDVAPHGPEDDLPASLGEVNWSMKTWLTSQLSTQQGSS